MLASSGWGERKWRCEHGWDLIWFDQRGLFIKFDHQQGNDFCRTHWVPTLLLFFVIISSFYWCSSPSPSTSSCPSSSPPPKLFLTFPPYRATFWSATLPWRPAVTARGWRQDCDGERVTARFCRISWFEHSDLRLWALWHGAVVTKEIQKQKFEKYLSLEMHWIEIANWWRTKLQTGGAL